MRRGPLQARERNYQTEYIQQALESYFPRHSRIRGGKLFKVSQARLGEFGVKESEFSYVLWNPPPWKDKKKDLETPRQGQLLHVTHAEQTETLPGGSVLISWIWG